MQDRSTRPDPNTPPGAPPSGGNPNTIWILVAVVAVMTFAVKYWQSSTPKVAGALLHIEALSGSRSEIVTERDCKAGKDRLWITDPEFTECIAYVVARAPGTAKAPSDAAVVFFNGDVPAGERSDQSSQATRDREQAAANRLADKHGVTTIIMGRPGLMGSTGFHQAGGMREDAYVMDRALDLLRDRIGIKRLALAGQSGGARLIAQMMVLGRRDIQCAAMASGAYDTPGLKGGGTVRTNIWGTPGRRYLVPMHEAEKIPVFSDRRSFVIGDPKDTRTQFAEQKTWAAKLTSLGHHAVLIEARGNGAENHGLAAAALTAAGNCANGVGDSDIRAALAQ